MGDGDVLEIDCLWRRKGGSSIDISVRVGNEVFKLFLALKAVDLAIEESEIFIIFNADFDIFSSYLIADWAEIEVF